MKINEISEAPISKFKQTAQGIGSKALKKLGMKKSASKMADKADLANTARIAYREFVQYLKSNNRPLNRARAKDIKSFLKSKGVDTSDITQKGVIDKKTINQIILDKSKQAMSMTKNNKQSTEPAFKSTRTKSDTPKFKSTRTDPDIDISKLRTSPSSFKKLATQLKTQNTKPEKKKSVQDRRIQDPYERYKSQMRKLSVDGGKPLPDQYLNSIGKDINRMAKGDKDSGAYAADKILKLAKAGRDVSGLQQRWLKNARVGERFLTQSVYKAVAFMLNECGLTWKDIGLSVRLSESIGSKRTILIKKI